MQNVVAKSFESFKTSKEALETLIPLEYRRPESEMYSQFFVIKQLREIKALKDSRQ